MSNEARELVRDYLNNVINGTDELNKYELEIMGQFGLERCPECKNFNLEEDMEYHKWDIGQNEEKICSDCRNHK